MVLPPLLTALLLLLDLLFVIHQSFVTIDHQQLLDAGIRSLAVLPLANLSGNAAEDFFADGMTEELTAALAKVPDLRVVARTSAFLPMPPKN